MGSATMEPPNSLPPRRRRLEELRDGLLDVLVVGGGITGCGIALDLAARGLRVAVVERGDWAGATSGASSRLIHGGLRYLEQRELGLVRESCRERGLMMRNAAGLVWPETFTFPIRRSDPIGRARLIAGLWLYTLVSLPRILGRPRILSPEQVGARIPGMTSELLRGGGSYVDGATDDARLTLAVLLTAIEQGAIALSRMEAVALEAGGRGVTARLIDRLGGEEFTIEARATVLAGGPFTDGLRERAGLDAGWVAPTRGAHILVPREKLRTDGAVIFPSTIDGRILFLFAGARVTTIGTTDLDAPANREVRATGAEVDYLLASARDLVPGADLGRDDVISTWAGLRPLLAAREDNPSARSREERLEREGPFWTIAGGKLTAWRSMAEKLGARITVELGSGNAALRSPTRDLRLHGAQRTPPSRPIWSPLSSSSTLRTPARPLEEAWSRRYASLTPAVRACVARVEGGEQPLDEETLLGEVDWAVEREDCLTARDFLFRRTDLALGPRDSVEGIGEMVLERMSGLCAWDEARRSAEGEELRTAIEQIHAWRKDPRV
jgi:glycerol-3-phosphate dehydrogenase